MSDNVSPGKTRILSLFIAFLILFVVLFSLGVIVGKGLSERDTKIAENIETASPRVEVSAKNIKTEPDELIVSRDISVAPDLPLKESPKSIRGEGLSKETGDEHIRELSGNDISKPNELPADQTIGNNNDEVKELSGSEAAAAPDPVTEDIINTKTGDKAAERASIGEKIKADKKKRANKVKLPPTDPQGSYTVQIGSFIDKKTAESVLHSMKSKGYPVFINTMMSSDNRKWYRVRIGTFDSVEIAEDYGENLKILEPEVQMVFITRNN